MQCDLSVPDELKVKFSVFTSIFIKTDITRNHIVEYMKTYAEENDLIKQQKRILITNFKLTNGTFITPLFNFYLDYSVQKFINLYNADRAKYSTVLFSLLLMLGEAVMKIYCLV